MKAVLCKSLRAPAETLVLEEIAQPRSEEERSAAPSACGRGQLPRHADHRRQIPVSSHRFPFLSGAAKASGRGHRGSVRKSATLKVGGPGSWPWTGWGSFAEEVAVPGYKRPCLMPREHGLRQRLRRLRHDLRHLDARPSSSAPNLQPGEDPAGARRLRRRRSWPQWKIGKAMGAQGDRRRQQRREARKWAKAAGRR